MPMSRDPRRHRRSTYSSSTTSLTRRCCSGSCACAAATHVANHWPRGARRATAVALLAASIAPAPTRAAATPIHHCSGRGRRIYAPRLEGLGIGIGADACSSAAREADIDISVVLMHLETPVVDGMTCAQDSRARARQHHPHTLSASFGPKA